MKIGGDFIEAYLQWLKEKMHSANIGDIIEITTPFLDRHNDHIQIYIKQIDNKYILTDDGVTISELALAGCDISTPKRRAILTTLVNRVGVKMNGQELFVDANEYNFPQKKHSLLQTIISVNDMFMLAKSKVESIFFEDIENYLITHDVRYTPDVQFIGKSGLPHTFDFVIPASRAMPERLIRALNNPTREKTEAILFSWNDTKEMRSKDSRMFVFLNDADRIIKSDIPAAFSQYGVKPILWSGRDNIITELTA